MKNLKVRTLWIIVAVLLLAAIGLIVACAYTDDAMNKFMIVLLAIDFIALTILVQYVSYRTFKYKAKPIKYPTKEYEGTVNNLDKLNYKKRIRSYGQSYLKTSNGSAYKIVFVDNIIEYFNQEEDNSSQTNKELEKCTKFIGIEIFNEVDEESLTKIPEFSIQGEKVYYTALVKQDNKYICMNFIDPLNQHKDNLEIILNDLGLKEIVEL